MAHFAKLDNDGTVLAVHVVNNDVITIDGVESEQAGIDFLTQLHGHSNWKQTSYSGSFRNRFAGINYKYDSAKDAFIPDQPFPSWILNETTLEWDAPVAYPTDGKIYVWTEATASWTKVSSPAGE